MLNRPPNSRPFALLALLLPLTLVSTASAEDAAASPEEIAAFKATVERYSERMKDFNQESRYIVDAWEAQERKHLADSYAQTITDLTARETELRDGSIERFEAFLAKYPTSEYTPHVMFRLGELYYVVAEETYLKENEEYSRAMAALDPNDFEHVPVPPSQDYQKSVDLYRRIVQDYPNYQYADGAYYMLGFCLGRSESKQFDSEGSRDMFAKLVETYPKSKFAADANLRLGEYYFDKDEIDEAIAHYQLVVDEGPEGKRYDQGLYKLAWSYYRKSKAPEDYDHALGLFGDLLDWSEQNLKDTGKETAMAPEAIQYMAISFSDQADRVAQDWVEGLGPRPSALDMTRRFFDKRGEREYEIKIVKRLADVLVQQARYDEAMATLQFIQTKWPYDEDNPTFQREIAQLHMNLAPPDPEGARDALLVLNEKYNDNSEWAAANRSKPEALDKSRKYIEESLAAVATNYHQSADMALEEKDLAKAAALVGASSSSPDAVRAAADATYRKAGQLYQEYLDKFPFANDYYEIQSYLATVLVNTHQLPEAEKVFEQLLKAGDNPYHDSSLWQLMQVRTKMLTEKYGTVEGRPESAVEEKKVALPSGKERVVFQIDDDHKRFIEVCDQLVDAQFTDKDYADALNQFRPALAYLPAQILYNYGHLEEARPRFEKVISTWPKTNEAVFSARLMVDSFGDEEDLARVRSYTAKYIAMGLGPENSSESKESVAKFKNLQEQAAFKMAEVLKDTDRAAAAEAFVAFLQEFPKSEYASKALYNAANSYDIIGRVDDANRLFEEYINKYPKDEQSAVLFYRIAFNYSSVLELDKAVKYYETLVTNFPDFADASGALYNAGFLRVGLGDAEGAAKNFERYAQKFPKKDDAELVYFSAGEQWKKVGDSQASAFYQRYLRAYPDANPDHVMEAYYQLAKLAEKTGNQRNIDKAWLDLSAAYQRLAPTGKIGPAGRHYAASVEFRKVEAELATIKVYKFTTNEEKNLAIIQEKKAAAEALIARTLSIISVYQDFEYSSGALFIQADAYYTLADVVYNVPCPSSFNEEMCDILREELDKTRLPAEEKGKERLKAILDLANQEKRWSSWQSKALQMLSERDPQNYAPDRMEIRGVGDSHIVPASGAVKLRPTKEAPPAAPTEQPPTDAPPTTPTPPTGNEVQP